MTLHSEAVAILDSCAHKPENSGLFPVQLVASCGGRFRLREIDRT